MGMSLCQPNSHPSSSLICLSVFSSVRPVFRLKLESEPETPYHRRQRPTPFRR
jgi:hypothetical protein